MIERRVRSQWGKDAALLARLGRQLEPQPLDVKVTLPRHLVIQAIARWKRNDPDFHLKRETRAQKRNRHRAGSLALIGNSLSLQKIGGG